MKNIYWIDLFCGAGGTSSGIHLASENNKVIACVNHDLNAIQSHKENHPEAEHFQEDIRDFKVVIKLKKIVEDLRRKYPEAIIAIWASLECTNFSNAKGGQPRDADSRSLAEHMYMYLENLDPEYFWVENVREFMSWGPLDEKGKPLSRVSGQHFVKWIQEIKDFGYKFDKKILNAADYGSYQSRQRLFIQFTKIDLPIEWPEQTHTKDKKTSDLFPMEKWKPVKEVLELDVEGNSIFNRKKPLSENTLKRIYAGLIKFVANGETEFLKKYFSGRTEGKVISLNGPSGAIKTVDGHAIIATTKFISQRNTGNPTSKVLSVDGPARTITSTGGNQEVITATHLQTYYGKGGVSSIETVSPTLTTKDRVAKVDVHFIDQQYGNGQPASVESPCNTITNTPKFSLVNAEKLTYLVNFNSSTSAPNDIEKPSPTITSVRTHYLVNPQFSSKGCSVDNPSPTLIARQDKKPLSVISVEHGNILINIFEEDSETMIRIKEFMALYEIVDIKMRMLLINELKQIQGFSKDYILKGSQTEQKKQIGNAVDVTQAKVLVLAMTAGLNKHFKKLAS